MFRVLILTVLLLAGAVRAASLSDAPQVVFSSGASSSGWIDFKPYKASGIFSRPG
jgi:hypothetical protein